MSEELCVEVLAASSNDTLQLMSVGPFCGSWQRARCHTMLSGANEGYLNADDSPTGIPGCFCRDGYIRNEIGVCVRADAAREARDQFTPEFAPVRVSEPA